MVTWNVGAFDKYGDSRELVATVIRHVDADLVSFNELDSCNRRHEIFQLRDVAGRLGYGYHFASAIPYEGGAYGNGIATRREILKRERIDLPKLSGAENRCVAVVETKDCVFASAHLDYLDAEVAAAQAVAINEWFEEHYNGSKKPVFLCGDMNSTPDSKAVKILRSRWTMLSPSEPTYPSVKSDRCIDYIFLFNRSRQVTVEEAVVLGEDIIGGISLASDHIPVYVQIRF